MSISEKFPTIYAFNHNYYWSDLGICIDCNWSANASGDLCWEDGDCEPVLPGEPERNDGSTLEGDPVRELAVPKGEILPGRGPGDPAQEGGGLVWRGGEKGGLPPLGRDDLTGDPAHEGGALVWCGECVPEGDTGGEKGRTPLSGDPVREEGALFCCGVRLPVDDAGGECGKLLGSGAAGNTGAGWSLGPDGIKGGWAGVTAFDVWPPWSSSPPS